MLRSLSHLRNLRQTCRTQVAVLFPHFIAPRAPTACYKHSYPSSYLNAQYKSTRKSFITFSQKKKNCTLRLQFFCNFQWTKWCTWWVRTPPRLRSSRTRPPRKTRPAACWPAGRTPSTASSPMMTRTSISSGSGASTSRRTGTTKKYGLTKINGEIQHFRGFLQFVR